MKTVADVLAGRRWRSVEDRHLRARLMEERAARLEAESARREEERRSKLEAKVRAAAVRFGFVEYMPNGESAERLEALSKTIWRKAYREYPFFVDQRLMARELAWWQAKHEQWRRKERTKALLFGDLSK